MNLKNKQLLLVNASICLILLLILGGAWLYLNPSKLSIQLENFQQGLFEHPADIIEFKDSFWVTELLSNHVIQSDLALSKSLKTVSHPIPNNHFKSPHYLSADDNLLFVSDGWGSSIYAFDKTLNKFKEYTHKNDSDKFKLNAPHGICRRDNWLYIADSLNSRLIRVDINFPEKFEIFADHDKLIAYGRQLLCEKDSLWLSNSYENRAGLNTGTGSNVLKITNFDSGRAEIITQFANGNITGIHLHQRRYLITAQWRINSISIFDTKRKEHIGYVELPQPYAGVPYGMFFSKKTKRLYITFIGDIYGKNNKGGIAVYTIQKKHSE